MITTPSHPPTPFLADAALVRAQRMEAVNQLAAGVAHEFNNVLQIVRGYVVFARNSLPPESEPRRDLDCAIEATDRAATLSRRLLQFARADDPDDTVADVADAIESLRLLLRPVIGENIAVEAAVEPELPRAAVGDSALRQALLNLCVNARDAMPAGGLLRLEARVARPAGDFDIGQAPAADCVGVFVSDTGEGIPAGVRRRVFEPFFTTKPAGSGSGLGLPIVASCVQGAGGCLRVRSDPGRGTRFELYLPLAPTDALPSPADDALPHDATPDSEGSP